MGFMNQWEIEAALAAKHACPNVRKGVRLLQALMRAANAQSDGWAYWNKPSNAAEKLQALLETAGKLNGLSRLPLSYGTNATITDAQLKQAVAPIRAMITRHNRQQEEKGRSDRFIFDVDAAMEEPKPEPAVFRLGDIVEPDDKKQHILACGSGTYAYAVVVSMDPFVMVSVDADMLWRMEKPEHYVKVDHVTDPKTLATCLNRLLNESFWKEFIAKRDGAKATLSEADKEELGPAWCPPEHPGPMRKIVGRPMKKH
jgi:hypothetical protein